MSTLVHQVGACRRLMHLPTAHRMHPSRLERHLASVASPSSSSSITSNTDLLTPIPYQSRLETHYYQTILEDLLVLTYDHSSPDASLEHLSSTSPEWQNNPSSPTPFIDLYSTPRTKLPSYNGGISAVTSLISKEAVEVDYFRVPKPKYGKLYLNPIDYTPVKMDVLKARPPIPPPPPYAPVPSRIVNLKTVSLRVWSKEAASNKNVILSCIMTLQAITGVRAEPLFATQADVSKQIRSGMALGAYCTLSGPPAFAFLDKLITCVLPRMNDWEGINPVGNGKGGITFKLSGQAVGLFPDIEPHFDSFPRLNDLDVLMETSGRTDDEAVLLLSGYQMPFLAVKEEVVKSAETGGAFDPWAQFRTRRERDTGESMRKTPAPRVINNKAGGGRGAKPTMASKKKR
ncbi:hypothetical protein SmJEL517_g05033 [Synchytrium microbalum]|uniref:Large ribosomal subunit protein uL5 C-terminal domain-containing protein n=1 Tax=Synchytrium microbalum TaxID=1806994 RepID=A0A507BNJ1_9FUNG|nr:uncharacterized protein SmJEL517_g05033 [Synchytrium microbalum]TPX31660.1 hypothetical protein SmJEL517_g05033 [Synchytrium microbalum]